MFFNFFICLSVLVLAASSMPIHQVDDYDMDTLVKTVYMEARGESQEGQAAVVYVIVQRARLNKGYWGGSKIADVCRKPGQFECWTHPQHIDTGSGEYQQVKDLAYHVIYDHGWGNQDDGSDHYNNPAKEGYPPWTQNTDQTKVIGNHHFYKTKPGH